MSRKAISIKKSSGMTSLITVTRNLMLMETETQKVLKKLNLDLIAIAFTVMHLLNQKSMPQHRPS